MEIISTTPFGQRPVTAGLLARQALAQKPAEASHYNKWELFRELCTARQDFDLTDRDLTVLNALLSFHRGDNLSDNDNLIVFPSNKRLAERAHGMAESTLRRHLAALTRSGVIARHDSPNGKRYAARDSHGDLTRAFGFDLRPLLVRARQITETAQTARETAEALKRTRETASLHLRDADKLLAFAAEEFPDMIWQTQQAVVADCRRAWRRKISNDEVVMIGRKTRQIAQEILALISKRESQETNIIAGNGGQNERHYHNSKTDSLEFEPGFRKDRGRGDKAHNANIRERPREPEQEGDIASGKVVAKDKEGPETRIPLVLVRKSCPEIHLYAKDGISTWHHLIGAAAFVRGMLGISPQAWEDAMDVMGPQTAATVVACILERAADIASPGGYLRVLTEKYRDGKFSAGPMVMALLNSERAGVVSKS